MTEEINRAGNPGDREVNNEGIFYMDIDSYMANFSQTTVNQDTHSWYHDYFLMLDDQMTSATTSNESFCQGCTRHVLTVKNLGNEKQRIHVGAHVWQDRGYGWGTTE
jgi:hypothetical protein